MNQETYFEQLEALQVDFETFWATILEPRMEIMRIDIKLDPAFRDIAWQAFRHGKIVPYGQVH
jgi:hypothetical protein